MNTQELGKEIDRQLALRKKKVLNRNAIGALFGAFADPVGALGRIFVGRDDAVGVERQRIAQEVTLELLCKIDDAISRAAEASSASGIAIDGLIETTVHRAGSVVGVHIADGTSGVTLKPGTHIRTVVTSANNVTGLRIGGRPAEK